MKVSALLLRLMWRPRLSPHVKLGPEDRLGIEIADQCRLWAMEGRLSAVFFHVPNEGGGANRRKAEIELAVKRALGYMPERVPLYEEMTVTSFLYFVAKVKGVSWRDRKSEVGRVMERCSLTDMGNKVLIWPLGISPERPTPNQPYGIGSLP